MKSLDLRRAPQRLYEFYRSIHLEPEKKADELSE